MSAILSSVPFVPRAPGTMSNVALRLGIAEFDDRLVFVTDL